MTTKELEICDDQIEGYYASLLQKELSPRSVRVVHNILHSALEKAVKYGLLIFNPTHGATLPRYSHQEMVVLDSYQVTQFLVAAQTSPNYAFFHQAITTGMRMSELFGLKWSDIQWNADVLHVQSQKQYVPGQGCSLLLNNKIPVIIVSNMLGDSKPSVTLDIYAHVSHDMQGEATILMDKLVTPIQVEISLKSVSIPKKN